MPSILHNFFRAGPFAPFKISHISDRTFRKTLVTIDAFVIIVSVMLALRVIGNRNVSLLVIGNGV